MAPEWYLTAIENHALTGGKRTAYWKDGSATFKERSGTVQDNINSDWINVDNWIGVVAEPKGAFIYQNAAKYNRDGAAEDVLLYKPTEKEQPRAVVIVPGKDAVTTAAVAKSVTWQASAMGIILNYIAPSGKKISINIPVNK